MAPPPHGREPATGMGGIGERWLDARGIDRQPGADGRPDGGGSIAPGPPDGWPKGQQRHLILRRPIGHYRRQQHIAGAPRFGPLADAETLGSPNIVSTDENRLEVWIYDKIATDVSYSNNEGGVWLVIAGVSGSSGASSTSQRTLTIVIKFDQDKKVRDFAYHSSSF